MLAGNISFKFEIIQKTAADFDNPLNISSLCKIAGVSRSGYYRWVNGEDVREKQEEADRADFELILAAYNKCGYTKGAQGIYMCFIHMDVPIIMNLKKIRRLMKKYQLFCPKRKANPYRRMAKAMKTSNYAPNLLVREFRCYGPRMVLLTDITYIPYNGIFAYLSTIKDAYTKQILAYVLSSSLEVAFVKQTVDILIQEHGVSLHSETLIHSDQGSHYSSTTFIKITEDYELRRSMSRRGNCWDNAPQESFFGHMKDDLKSKLTSCTEFKEVKAYVDDFMDYYNNERYQWGLAKLAPNEYYRFITTGEYPLSISNIPTVPRVEKSASELGRNQDSLN